MIFVIFNDFHGFEDFCANAQYNKQWILPLLYQV